MINPEEVVHTCKLAPCAHLTYTGRCLEECLKYYKKQLGEKTTTSIAYWRHRGAHNDFLWCECSNCGFRIEAYIAVKAGKSSTDYTDVKYRFCPMCGKEMRV